MADPTFEEYVRAAAASLLEANGDELPADATYNEAVILACAAIVTTSLRIPPPAPEAGDYALQSSDGVLSWVGL